MIAFWIFDTDILGSLSSSNCLKCSSFLKKCWIMFTAKSVILVIGTRPKVKRKFLLDFCIFPSVNTNINWMLLWRFRFSKRRVCEEDSILLVLDWMKISCTTQFLSYNMCHAYLFRCKLSWITIKQRPFHCPNPFNLYSTELTVFSVIINLSFNFFQLGMVFLKSSEIVIRLTGMTLCPA